MAILENYLTRINYLKTDINELLTPYSDNSILEKKDQESLRTSLKTLKELTPNDSPRIMLYGLYNAGKSTLINAFTGNDLAEVGDFPVTMQTKAYEWEGYRIIDSPGVDVTGDEEKRTMDELTKCNVVIFVLCHGDIDHADVYERIEKVYRKGKKIIIALNCKNGEKPESSLELSNQIRKNLREIIGEQIPFTPICVDALNALYGKKKNSAKMIDYSNIVELEKEIRKVLREVDGYSCYVDCLKEITDLVSPYKKILEEVQLDDSNLSSKINSLDKDYRNFYNSLSETVKTETFSLSKKLLRIAIDNEKEPDSINAKLNEEIANFDKGVMERVKDYITSYLSDLSEQLGQVVAEFNGNPDNAIKIDSEKLTGLADTIANKPKYDGESLKKSYSHVESSSHSSNSNAALGDSISALGAVIPKTLVTPPIGPIPPIPVGMIVAIAGQVLKLFGGGNDNRNSQVEAEVEAEREAQLRMAEMKEQWRHEMKEQCEVICMDIEREEINRARNWIKSAVDPYRQKTKEILSEYQENKAQIIQDNEKFNVWINNVNALISELKAMN